MKKCKSLINIIWWIYIALLFLFVIIKFRGSISSLIDKVSFTEFGTNYNLVPLRSVGVQLKHVSEGWALMNLLGNIVPFVPFGFLLPLYYRKAKPFISTFIIGLLFILFVEGFQFITRLGSFDVDDIILNMVGIILGHVMIRIVSLLIDKREEK